MVILILSAGYKPLVQMWSSSHASCARLVTTAQLPALQHPAWLAPLAALTHILGTALMMCSAHWQQALWEQRTSMTGKEWLQFAVLCLCCHHPLISRSPPAISAVLRCSVADMSEVQKLSSLVTFGPQMIAQSTQCLPAAQLFHHCCSVADLAQTVDGAFELPLVLTHPAVTKLTDADNLRTCAQRCRDNDDCAGVTFDYLEVACYMWKPVTDAPFLTAGG
jgi:hypothetical protein